MQKAEACVDTKSAEDESVKTSQPRFFVLFSFDYARRWRAK